MQALLSLLLLGPSPSPERVMAQLGHKGFSRSDFARTKEGGWELMRPHARIRIAATGRLMELHFPGIRFQSSRRADAEAFFARVLKAGGRVLPPGRWTSDDSLAFSPVKMARSSTRWAYTPVVQGIPVGFPLIIAQCSSDAKTILEWQDLGRALPVFPKITDRTRAWREGILMTDRQVFTRACQLVSASSAAMARRPRRRAAFMTPPVWPDFKTMLYQVWDISGPPKVVWWIDSSHNPVYGGAKP